MNCSSISTDMGSMLTSATEHGFANNEAASSSKSFSGTQDVANRRTGVTAETADKPTDRREHTPSSFCDVKSMRGRKRTDGVCAHASQISDAMVSESDPPWMRERESKWTW